MSCIRLKSAVSITACLVAQVVQSAPTVTAEHAFPDSYEGRFKGSSGMAGIAFDSGKFYDNRRAQTFVAEATGRLHEISFVASRHSGTTADLRVGIYTVSDRQPASAIASVVLGVEEFQEFDPFLYINPPQRYTSVAHFSTQQLTLEAQQTYAIVYSTDEPEARYSIYMDHFWPYSEVNYPGGSFLQSQNGRDFTVGIESADSYFQVTVTPAEGDFNADGAVDAADYTTWRDGLGATYDQDDYTTWRTNYGATADTPMATLIPEPASGILVFLTLGGLTWRRRR